MLTEVLELRIGQVITINGVPVSLGGTKRDAATLVVGRLVVDRNAVRQAAERYRKRLDKNVPEDYDKGNSRPAN